MYKLATVKTLKSGAKFMNELSRKVRILQVNYSLNRGGAETWLVNVMRLIDKKKYAVDFLLHIIEPCDLCDEIVSLGGRIFSCGTMKNPLRYSMKFIQNIKRFGPFHIVHTHSGIHGALDVLLARIAGVPIRIVHSRSELDELGPSILWKFYRIVARWVIRRFASISLGVSRKALFSIIGVSKDYDRRFQVIHSGTDLDRFHKKKSRDELRAALSIPKNSPVIGHIGNFRTPKNHRFLVSIAQHVKKILPEALFILIGDGPLIEEIKIKVQMLGLKDSFIFTGHRDDCPFLLSIMDCFLFPSLWEGFPQALIEAQAAGLNCVISKRITEEAIIIPILVHRMSLSQSAIEWADTICKVLDKPSINSELAISMIEESIGNVKKSKEKVMNLYIRLIREVYS